MNPDNPKYQNGLRASYRPNRRTGDTVILDPARFTDEQWMEAFYAGATLYSEHRAAHKVRQVPVALLKRWAEYCRIKANNLPPGGTPSEDARWKRTLRDAANTFENLARGK